ncbi:MAG: diguanylate cyclase [Oscillospiraceae bacterium]|nr:diguanylate cyclase [Oscillospiraceae bacterium]
MNLNYLLIVSLLIAFVINIALAGFSITRKDNSRSVYFTMLTFTTSLYTLGCILLGLSYSSDAVSNALSVINIGLPLIGLYFFLINLSLFQADYIKRWMLPASLTYGIVMFVFSVFTNKSNRLFFADVTTSNGSINIVCGPLYWVEQVVGFIFMLSAFIILCVRFVKGSRKFRQQTIYILVGGLFMVLSNVSVNFFMSQHSQLLSILPVLTTITLLFLFANLSKYQLLDITSIVSNTAIEIMSDAMIIVDNDLGFLFCNKSAKTLFPALNSFHDGDIITKVKDWPAELAYVNSPCEKTFKRRTENDKFTTYRAKIDKVIGKKETPVGWYIIINDTTDVTFLINQLEDLATTDSLTGIANRRYFLERVHRELEMSAPDRLNLSNSLIMFDIDFFKKINDNYSHLAGDYVLCAVAETIKNKLRSYDIFGRYGGDECIIFTTATEEDAIYNFALRLCRAVENTDIIYENQHISVTASFGAVQIYPGDTFDEALAAVDSALYKAKYNGRNQVVIGKIPRNTEKTENINKSDKIDNLAIIQRIV